MERHSSFMIYLNRKLLKNLSLLIISILIFFTIAEVLTRLFWNVRIEKQHEGVILTGENRSYIHEGILYKTNSLGIRNKEISKGKQENCLRVLAIGDSYTWGDGLSEDKLVTTKLENLLTKESTGKIEVINAGICGYNTEDEYHQLTRLFPVYQPDLIILFFFTNDLLARDSSGIQTDWKANFNMFMRENSKFYAFLYYLWLNSEIAVPDLILPSDYFNLDDNKSGWVSLKNYFLKIKDYCRSNKAGFIFVVIPTLTNLDENYPYMELNNKVNEFVKSNNVPFLSYYELFSGYEPKELWISLENVHWNDKATSLAADELAKFVLKNGFEKKLFIINDHK